MNNLRKAVAGLIVALALASAVVFGAVTHSSAEEAKCVPTYDDSHQGPYCTPNIVQ
jgi:hypothetical protein